MPADGEQWHESDPRLRPGLALLRTRQLYAASQYFRKCISESAGGAAWFYLGAAQHALGQLKEAASSFSRAAEQRPQTAEARCARAAVLAELGETSQAEEELRTLVAQHPAHARALCNLGILLQQRGATVEALAFFGKAIEADPTQYAARLSRGAMHLAAGEPALGLEDFNALLPTHDNAEIQTLRARALFALHRDEDALQASEKALAIEPTNARAWLDNLLALSSLRRFDQASLSLQRAAEVAGDALFALANGPRRAEDLDPRVLYVDRALQRQDVCAWADRADVLKAIRAMLEGGMAEKLADPGILFRMLALPLAPAELKVVGEAVARRAARLTGRIESRLEASLPGDRMRIGFLSPEFRLHPGAWLLRRLFLDRDRGKFEFFAYALNADDGSGIRADLVSASDAFVDVSASTTENLIRRIRADRLDLLVDSSGLFVGTRPEVLAARVAPVQAGYVGIACTLGPGLLDYRISDALTTP
ncbi:MAG TPA: tetratricopeptide repeat protein, partial [Woeseiaceae bacterium]|nr:tetratricopeptide repeat protein [Woeseiaceae bacterium]